jgi:hypothetical protein
MEIGQPTVFGGRALFQVVAYALVLVIPVLLAVTIMSLFKIGMWLSVLIPVAATAATVLVLPFGLGNPEITRLVRTMKPVAGAEETDFIVQLTLAPRIRRGWRALLEDADDIGRLSFIESNLIFQGDSIRLRLPFVRVSEVRRQNIGLRGLFVYGPRIAVRISGIPEVDSIEFAERASWLLPASRRITARLHARLLLACKSGKPQSAS